MILENAAVRVVVLPGLGGRVLSLVDKRADVELLWRNERVPVRPAGFGSSYDDHFLGGWDELYPNDAPEVLVGEPVVKRVSLGNGPELTVDYRITNPGRQTSRFCGSPASPSGCTRTPWSTWRRVRYCSGILALHGPGRRPGTHQTLPAGATKSWRLTAHIGC